MPYRWLRALGAVIGWLAGSVLRIRRAHVERAMINAGVAAPGRTARAMYRALGAGVMELLWVARKGREELARVVRIDAASREALARACAARRGVVLAASHTGNWELAAHAFAAEMNVLIVAKRLSVRVFEAFIGRLRRRHGIRVARPGRMLAPAYGALARGGAVALMIDQVPARAGQGLTASFLGEAAILDRAPAALAACTGAPLLVTAARREPDGTHTLSILVTLEPPPGGRRAWIEHATREATRALEVFVREHPSEWLWMHRRWRAPLAAPAACLSRAPSLNEPGHAA